jgi:hypothetical protein
MKELFIPGFEGGEKAILLPKKKNPSKEKMTFKLNFDELFHSELYGSLPTAGKTPLQVLEPTTDIYPKRLVPFNVAYSEKDYDCTVHFFIHDGLFIRVLRDPEKYLPFFQKCHSAIGPDLSQYANMLFEERYFAAYINRAFTLYLQRNGVTVIPNVTWSLPDSYEYSFTGVPHYSVVAINSNGVMKHDASKYLWQKGYQTACHTLHPCLIVRYGTVMPNEHSEISIYFENERLKYLKNGSSRKF